MIEINKKQQEIIGSILQNGTLPSSAVRAELTKRGENVSLVTVKRLLSDMTKQKVLKVMGSGRSTRYEVAVLGRVFFRVDARSYCSLEPDQRYGLEGYNFQLLPEFPQALFDRSELRTLESATNEYVRRTKSASPVIQHKELERLVIELSWKSSKIEGNTYSLLDTEKLIMKHKEAAGHDKQEALMILNHKDAFHFIRDHTKKFITLTRANLEHVHSILMKGLGVQRGMRKGPVGVTGSRYRPLDNVQQILEAVHDLSKTISNSSDPYAKALLALLGVSYIQPFEDGNKRTARLMANALLMAHRCAPLSYRSVDENEYRDATLVFYELNSIQPFRKLFIEQYDFAARNYVA